MISIILPVYNQIQYLKETLNSILTQSFCNWECIIVDDGSSKETIQLLIEYCNIDDRIKFYNRPANRIKGANSCRNYGYEKSRGE